MTGRRPDPPRRMNAIMTSPSAAPTLIAPSAAARTADGRLSVRRTVHPLNQKLHAIYKEKSEKHG